MHKDQTKDRFKAVQGKAKEISGKPSGDKTQEGKGKPRRAGGKGQGLYGDLKANLMKSYGPPSR